MEGVSENIISVIKQNDPDLPQYLDFEKLRKEGLEHIGNLSGKIWTDHNVHDPGITILEVLVYALMDLGYKTNLPFKDLIAKKNNQEKDDNFLTPLEILTINPVTITDYRKLLLEIEGVRNAWLEPVDQEINLYINQDINSLSCTQPTNPDCRPVYNPEGGYFVDKEKCEAWLNYEQLQLNGLYKVYIEKEIGVDDNELKREVIKLLSKHRNLCEDFIDIKILEPINFGVCVDVEIRLGYDPKMIYAKIIKELKKFIQPEIKYYTLNELLDKGKTIDDIFAGRPYSKESFGFVDTDEFEQLKKRSKIHLSDLYNVILSIEGVRKIKKIHIAKEQPGGDMPRSTAWKQSIEECQVPVFSIDDTCVDLYSEQGILKIDKFKILKSLSFGKKFRLPEDSLDSEIPIGVYRDDMTDYYSVQNDFPAVYGIGEDGLPDSASLLRKTQALQLKGYLMFYDQILANYTSQLANIRSLFSMKSEKERSREEKRTYFTQIPETIPGIEDLLRFYDENTIQNGATVLAYLVLEDDHWGEALQKLEDNPRIEFSISNYCEDGSGLIDPYSFPSVSIRSIYINQLIDSFFTKNYTIQILEDRFGYFFVLYPSLPDKTLLVGTQKYKTINEAKNEAQNVAFFATASNNYSLVTNKSQNTSPDQHYFGITAHPISYIDLIQELTEDKEEYILRRKQFLDHLLARFGEDFTDYTLLQYKGKLSESQLNEEMINDQSSYINEFAELSRNRGKAFDYLEPSWNTDNVSGFEKRVSLLSGMNNYQRRNLCNFEVTECQRIILKDPKGNLLFRSNISYGSKKELNLAAKKILLDLRDSNCYERLEKKLNGFDSDVITRIFCKKPTDENIKITKYHYYQQLLNKDNTEVIRSKNTKMASKEIGIKKREDFIKNIDKQTSHTTSEDNKKYRLLPIDKKNYYLDVNQLDHKIDTLTSWKWHIKDAVSKEKISSKISFKNEEEAWEQIIKQTELDKYLTTHNKGHKWTLDIADEKISFQGLGCYRDRDKAIAAWRKAKVLGNSSKNYVLEKDENTYRVLLKNEKKKIVAISEEYKNQKEDIIDECIRVFKNRRTKPNYREEKTKIGFKIPVNDNITPLVSYCVYDSKKEALQEISKVFELGTNKKNYLQSGDEGNPEYNFLLRDKYDSFLTVPPEDFETASQRDVSLLAILRFFKDSEQPIIVKEEPRKYVWSLSDNEKNIALKSEAEFSSKARAQSNFDKTIAIEALKSCSHLCADHLYKFEVTSIPAEYKYVYGTSSSLHELHPIFMSENSYKNEKEASKAYAEFVEKLPKLSLKVLRKNKSTSEFSLYDKNTPIAVQYSDKEIKGTIEDAKEITSYISRIYIDNATPNEEFAITEMVEGTRKSYEWRFYKKNTPLVKNPYLCNNREESETIKGSICTETPPIDLKICPPKQIVVCPQKNKNIYHYQICYNDKDGNKFVLISYVGYTTRQEAEEAYKKEWLDVIKLARDKDEYTDKGKINVKEEYKDPESEDCNETTFIAVIPKDNRKEIENKNKNLVDCYVRLANFFPIYKVEIEEDGEQDQEIEKCKDKYKYKYRVVIPKKESEEGKDCINNSIDKYQETLLWDSVDCFDSIEEAIQEYQYFYTLAETPNNCRVLCEKGKFYVGIVEVLAESACDYGSEKDAWDTWNTEDSNGNIIVDMDSCGNCTPGGVREFIYAAENDRNYIRICDQQYWKFKIVSPSYFVADHTCWYNSEAERDEQIEILDDLDWSNYMSGIFFENNHANSDGTKLEDEPSVASKIELAKLFCNMVHQIRECLKICSKNTEKAEQNDEIRRCIEEKLKTYTCTEEEIKNNTCNDEKLIQHHKVDELLQLFDSDIDTFYASVDQYPIYKTDEGYCYKLYWPKKNDEISREILQPCGCEEETNEDNKACDEEYPFISSNCYSCCSEALIEFYRFYNLIENTTYSFEFTSKTKHGPYSFQIIDTEKELAYHPQQYTCLQEVEDAIKMTKECIDNAGMHLLEHILLRPKDINQCHEGTVGDDEYENQRDENCLLPICPDYKCRIDWQPDIDRDDPCAENPEANMIHYLPGSDPYSFWATVVLPSWIKRFRTEESRQMFEKLLYKEVPALVGLNILWLSPQDMCTFEDEYRRWLEWIQVSEKHKYDPNNPKYEPIQNTCEPENGLPICTLVNSIKTLKSELSCPSILGEQGDCDCLDDEMINDNDCCLPNETEGTIFWSCCEDLTDDQIPGYNVAGSGQAIQVKSKKSVKEKSTVKSKEVKKKVVPETKTTVKKAKGTVKRETKKDESGHDLLALVRQRKPKYLSNIKTLADDDMQKTKSYGRTMFFLQNAPTVAGYMQLVNFFKRYSLQKDNDIEGFLGLIKNATWHMLDKLVLDQKAEIKEEEVNDLKSCFTILSEKGLSLKEMGKEWKIEDIKPLANTKSLDQIKKLVK